MSSLCPKCGAEYHLRSGECVHWVCGTVQERGKIVNVGYDCLERQLAAAEARIAELEASQTAMTERLRVMDRTTRKVHHDDKAKLLEMTDKKEEAEARVAELEKTLNSFAKTEDGVTIVPNMILWSIDSEGVPWWHKFGVIPYKCNDWAKGTYSTREAAEAVLAKGEK